MSSRQPRQQYETLSHKKKKARNSAFNPSTQKAEVGRIAVSMRQASQDYSEILPGNKERERGRGRGEGGEREKRESTWKVKAEESGVQD